MASANSDDDSIDNRPHSCFDDWLNLQRSDLEEILGTLNSPQPEDPNTLVQLVEKSIQHFQDYMNNRTRLARSNPATFYTPAWCSKLENSLLPTLAIRLVYALCGSDLETRLAEVIRGERTGSLADLNASQLRRVDGLQRHTVQEEERLTGKMASLQEEIADHPLAIIAKASGEVGELTPDVTRAFAEHERAMASLMEEADELRMKTLKELTNILTPMQSIDYLAGAKKLHLSMHQWGMRIDREHQLG
ncbi:Transcription factor TGA like domain [Dillenia turbinata]|uniref:Transcription factor TGA like domain n=1 Tax=Dillenia turbinata TaxID=194707 RepID=A0AAN8UXM0_9MAGN